MVKFVTVCCRPNLFAHDLADLIQQKVKRIFYRLADKNFALKCPRFTISPRLRVETGLSFLPAPPLINFLQRQLQRPRPAIMRFCASTIF